MRNIMRTCPLCNRSLPLSVTGCLPYHWKQIDKSGMCEASYVPFDAILPPNPNEEKTTVLESQFQDFLRALIGTDEVKAMDEGQKALLRIAFFSGAINVVGTLRTAIRKHDPGAIEQLSTEIVEFVTSGLESNHAQLIAAVTKYQEKKSA